MTGSVSPHSSTTSTHLLYPYMPLTTGADIAPWSTCTDQISVPSRVVKCNNVSRATPYTLADRGPASKLTPARSVGYSESQLRRSSMLRREWTSQHALRMGQPAYIGVVLPIHTYRWGVTPLFDAQLDRGLDTGTFSLVTLFPIIAPV